MSRAAIPSWMFPAVLLMAGAAYAGAIDVSDQEPWERCGYCHGIDGVSAVPRFPHLAGQRSDYLRKQLLDFAQGARRNDDGAMTAVSQSLTSQETEQVIVYFSQQTLPAPVVTAGGEDAAKLYKQGAPERGIPACAGCHGGRAEGSDIAPALAGQHVAYLRKQLTDFTGGRRLNAGTSGMPRIATALTVSERHALGDYLAGIAAVSALPVTRYDSEE